MDSTNMPRVPFEDSQQVVIEKWLQILKTILRRVRRNLKSTNLKCTIRGSIGKQVTSIEMDVNSGTIKIH